MPQATTSPRSRASFEEPILLKYSPHHELPLSTASSVGLHALIVGLLIIGGIIIARMNWDDRQKPVETDAVTEAGGGGGNPQGPANQPGQGISLPDGEEPPRATDRGPIDPTTRREPLKGIPKGFQLPIYEGQDTREIIENGSEAARNWMNLRPDVGAKLDQALARGKDGPGSNGSGGPGTGPGSGDKSGPGTGNDERIKRRLRWVLIFNTRDGRDYKRQLAAFGAILAIPDPKNPDGHLVMRDLDQEHPPARPEDIGKIEGIWWYDNGTASVASLSRALGLEQLPPEFIVFFSREFEEKLVRLEKAYKDKEENEITETRFDVRKRGNTYEPVVVGQEFRKR